MARSSRKKSTTVRTKSIRLGFRIGEWLAPESASRIATRLWFRLPARRSPLRAAAPAGATEFRLDTTGTTVWGYEWGSGPLIYLNHGWGGGTGDFDTLAANLVAHGYRVVAFDSPSHGNSGPGPYGRNGSSPLQFIEAFGDTVARFGPPHSIVAHSMGALSTVTALRQMSAPKRLVLVSPFIGGEEFTALFGGAIGLGRRTRSRFIAHAEAQIGKPMSYFSIPRPALDIETLVIHDRHDRATPYAHGEAIAEAWPNATLHTTQRTGHLRILHNPEVVGAISDFIDKA